MGVRTKSLCFIVLFSPFPAFAVPDKTRIDVSYHSGEITYIHKNTDIKCSQNKQGGVILGCARDKKNVKMRVSCRDRTIKIDFFSTDREVEIHSDLKKGTCEYNNVLEHEMTHMTLHSSALQNVVDKGMEDILDAFNGQFNAGKGCSAASQAARRAFDSFVLSYQKEDKRINRDFDRNDADSVFLNCKPPPSVTVRYQREKERYVSTDRVECRGRVVQCLRKTDCSSCKAIPPLSCTEMRIGLLSDARLYSGRIDVVVSSSDIRAKISSRYPVNSCGYNLLKKHEKNRISRLEEKLSGFTETLKSLIEKEYYRGLEKNLSGEEVFAAVQAALEKRMSEMNGKLAGFIAPLTEKEIRETCSE